MPKPVARVKEAVVEKGLFAAGILSILLVALIFAFIAKEAFPLFKNYSLMSFLLGTEWQPALPPPVGPQFGLIPNLWGSFLVTAGAILIAVPFGLGTAIFIADVAPRRIREWLKALVELLTVVPSVALGFVGVVVVSPIVKAWLHLDTGKSAVAASIILAFIALPTIVTIAEDAINAIPQSYQLASLSLGATEWQGLSRIIVPAAFPGIFAAIMLGVGRAIGETMVVIMVTGNAGLLPTHGLWYAFTHSVRTLTGTIGSEALEVAHGEPHYNALFMLGVVLFLITFGLNYLSGRMLSRSIARVRP